ncbi:MAG: methylaspartate mutase accessory protein GlmL [Sterolibacterium sp.]
MNLCLLIDFGSTYTKVVAVDLDGEEILAVAQSPSTVDTNVMQGLQKAIELLKPKLGQVELKAEVKLACSSAAGGLRMVAIGLVTELTAEAAKRAALGAGAKLMRVFSYQLNRREIAEIEEIRPDMILLAGGTDGGNQEAILHNARLLTASSLVTPIVIAGNKEVADDVADLLKSAGKPAYVTENVMPDLENINVEPVRELIRNIFMERIVHAKGIDKANDFVHDIIMPTPMASLNAAKLLADGTKEEPGLGELIIIEVGGATTNIHSISKMDTLPGLIQKGLPEPYAKRTVEGDMGLRINATSILNIVGKEKITESCGGVPGAEDSHAVETAVHALTADPSSTPSTEADFRIDHALASTAVNIAVQRHAGEILTMYTASGPLMVQYGKNLSDIKTIVGTGGIFAYGHEPRRILENALDTSDAKLSLRPRSANFYVDRQYILFAMGLLSQRYPDKALRIMKKSLTKV